MFNKVAPGLLEALKDIVRPENCLSTPEKVEPYSRDETPMHQAWPEVVVRVASTEQVSAVMKLASKEHVPVTPRAGGTGLSGGAIPACGGIVIAFEKMNRLKEVDVANSMVVVEPGLITGDLAKSLEKQNLFFPPDPVSIDSCCIGGNIAENAGGPKAVKYGVTRNYVMGMEVVLPQGTVLRMSGKLLKNVTGYSIMDLLIGSEGTLALITEATLKVLPLPRSRVDMLVPYARAEQAAQFATRITQAGLLPSAVELMDGEVVRACEKFLGRPIPFAQAGVHLIVQFDGDSLEHVRRQYEPAGEIALETGAEDVLVGEDRPTQERIWEPRKKTGEMLKAQGRVVSRDDLVVPRSHIPELLNQLKAIEESYRVRMFAFGHMGDGNIHVDMVARDGFDEARVRQLSEHVYRVAINLGGAITAEHGIGLIKKSYLSMVLDPAQIGLMKALKHTFDPQGILNPGKIFPDDSAGPD